MLKLFGGGGGNGDGKTRWQGKTFRIERYHVTVEDVLAEGGFALVFQVKGGRGQRYALKRMAVNNEQDLYLARQEVAITKALSDCPHSVAYLASSISQTAPDVHEVLILLQLYTGGRVVDMMNARLSTGFTEAEVLKIFTDVCQAVARLHHRTKPIIHRDLKVENILRDSQGNYVLCDYGSCTVKPMHPEVQGAALCEEQIARFTTLPYRAPEMVSLYSGNTITTKADIWALGCLLFKLCFFTTPFGEQPLAIVSGTFYIPDKSQYSETLHSLIRYMLEPDTKKRPNIWQVTEVAFRLCKTRNTVKNVFHSAAPPSSLPVAPRTTHNKTTSPQSGTKAPVAKETTPLAGNTSHLQPSTVVSSRERPRARPNRAPSPNFPRSHIPTHLFPPKIPTAMTISLDSGLNQFGQSPARGERTDPRQLDRGSGARNSQQQQQQQQKPQRKSRNIEQNRYTVHLDQEDSTKLDQFGQPYFTGAAAQRRSSDPMRDEFGHTPFATPQGHTHLSGDAVVDEFGAPRFSQYSASKETSASGTSLPSQDLFGSRPFVQPSDTFGATPFVTS